MSAEVEVAKALKPMFTTVAGKQFRDSIGFTARSVVVACHVDDHVVDVLKRAQEGAPPALVAFLCEGRLRIMVVTPDHEGSDRPAQPVARRVTVGMLFDAAAATGETRFRLSDWGADQVASVPERVLEPVA